jgi:tetratricopeptide (TPR) repeat protein
LSPLGTEDTTRLVAGLLGRVVLPAETLARLLEHAGGNPLYAEEFVRMLTDEGALGRGAELRDENIRVPDTVQSLIAARLDTLRPERKALLHDAAVVGKVFWAGAVASMGGTDERTVRDGLHELARKELVRSARSSSVADQAEYAFSHAIARDVAYAQIPRADRARKHVAAAEWIEAIARERVTDHAELLAHHYEQAIELSRAAGVEADAELPRRARRFLELAGDRANSLDLTKARTFYRRALAFHESDDLERARVLVKLALVDPDTLADEQELRAALEIYRAHGNELREGWVLVHLAQYALIQGESARADDLISQALEVLERHPPGEELAAAYTRRAASFALASRSQEALDTSNKALAIAEELGLKGFESRALQYHGIARVELGDDRGFDDIRRGLELGREIADLPSVAFAFSNLGTLTLTRSAREAATVYDEGVDFCERRGMRGSVMWLRSERTWILYDLGRWDEILREVEKVEGWSRDVEPGYVSLIALPQKALVLLSRGQLDGAAPLVEEFLPRARKAKDPQVLQPALTAAAVLAVARGEPAGATALVREAETNARSTAPLHHMRYLPQLAAVAVAADAMDAVRALLQLDESVVGGMVRSLNAARAICVEATGEAEAALTLYERAADEWAEHGSVPEQARSLFGAGRCLLALGRPHEAASRLHEARELYQGLGATPSVVALDEALARATSVSA